MNKDNKATPAGPDCWHLKSEMWDVMKVLEAGQLTAPSGAGLPTGFTDLDDLTTGFHGGDLVLLGGRPSMGKSALALNITANLAIEKNVPVGWFGLDETRDAFRNRLLSAEARVDSARLRKGSLREDDLLRLRRAAGVLSAAPIWVYDGTSRQTAALLASIRRLVDAEGVQLVVVDSLQSVEATAAGDTSREYRPQTLSAFARGLKALAMELNVAIVLATNVSSDPERRAGDHRPQLSDLREAGSVDQDADVVLFVFRQELYEGPTDKDGNSLEGRAEVIVAKQRHGPIGFVDLFFHKAYTRFENYSPAPK